MALTPTTSAPTRAAQPFAAGEQAVVFTGAMDYWPNVDAVTWFVQDMLPALRQQHPAALLHRRPFAHARRQGPGQ